ncbi:MAG: alpha/beta hydrolase [Solirubrobacterales bacterium]|nr:alpha/beta hydrolase [Solirubrobacterales bacterium]
MVSRRLPLLLLVALLLMVGSATTATAAPSTAADARGSSRTTAAPQQAGTRPKGATKGRAARSRTAKARRRAALKRRAAQKRRAAARRRAEDKRQAATAVRSLPVSFTVRNTNTSNVPCAADGATYEVKGHITGRIDRITAGDAAALYVHGLGYGEFFWTYRTVPGYDYATEQAARGLVSVTIDRLGYGASGRPDGNEVCYGSEADYLHQIVQQLKSGDYALDGAPSAQFGRIALVGHSAGGFMVEGAAASFGDVDALVVAAFSNLGASPLTLATFGATALQCATNPKPGNYGDFGQTDADFAAGHFFDVDPAVAADVLRRRAPDPCQDTGSAPQAIVIDALQNLQLKIPVLILSGEQDALFPPPAGALEKALFAGNPDLTQVNLPGTGHAVTLGRSAPQFRTVLGDWLKDRGF